MLRKVLQRVDRPLAVLREQRPLVAAVVPDAGHMPHQLAQRHGPLLLRELRHVGLNLVVELQPVLLQQQADRGRRERRGGGADPEPRVWRDGHAVLEIRPAKAFGPHDVATDADRHRQSRQVLLDEAGADDLPRLLHRVGPLWRSGPNASRRARPAAFGCRRRCRGADVHRDSHDHRDQRADGEDDARGPAVPALRHVDLLCHPHGESRNLESNVTEGAPGVLTGW